MSESSFITDFRVLLEKYGIKTPKFAYGSAVFDSVRPKVLYSGPMYGVDEIVAATSALVEGKWFVAGEHVTRFERMFSQYLGVTDSVMVNSGSSADLIAVSAAKVRYGWEDGCGIIVSPTNFPTTVSSITLNGLRPVFVDIELETLNASNSEMERKLWDERAVAAELGQKSQIKAILVSPVLGNPPNIDEILRIAQEHNLKVILDGCDSIGGLWRGKHLAQYADISTCSLFPSHHLSVGQGGMVSSNDKELIALVYSMATWGKNCWCTGAGNMLPNGCCGKRFSAWLPSEPDLIVDHRYVFGTDRAFNLRPLDLQGALGCVQMGKLEEIHTKRRNAYKRILKALLQVGGVTTARCLEEADPSWFGVSIICLNSEYKRKLITHLENAGIQTREYFAGNLLAQPGYAHLGEAKDYPNAQQVLRRVFFIGNAPFLTEDHFQYIEATLASFRP